MNNDLAESIGEIFKDARMNSRYRDNLSGAARAACISPRLLISIEAGRERIRDYKIYARLCGIYKISLKDVNDRVESDRLERRFS